MSAAQKPRIPIGATSIMGLVLSGGRGLRMGAVDKGLQPFRGKPLIAHVLDRLAPQVASIVISANRNRAVYARFGHAVVEDLETDQAGPLAGLQAGLAVCGTELIVAVPCDTPFLPLDLVARLAAALDDDTVDLATVTTPQRSHPVFCMVRRTVRRELDGYLAAGKRSVHGWIAELNSRAVSFEDEHAFSNFNTFAELQGRPTATDDL